MADIDELLGYAVNQQPTKFASAFDDVMRQKIQSALENQKIEVASAMFDTDDEDDIELDDEDLDLDDEDLDLDDDEDFDDDEEFDEDDFDLDLDDEDLEGWDDDDGEDA